MKTPELFFVGFNGFNQFKKNTENCVNKLEKINLYELCPDQNEEIQQFSFHVDWSYNAIAINDCVYFTGEETRKIKLEKNITKITGNNNYCLILLENDILYQYTFKNEELKILNFLNLETEEKQNKDTSEKVIDIATGETFSVAVTNFNSIYNIPTKLITLKKHEKIKKICCGIEHAILLTCNGDVYTWGSGTRGQNGKADLASEDVPTILEALAGIKIKDIAGGGWNSAAVSAFGDLYMWGWNINGQLGIKLTNKCADLENEDDNKCHSVYSLPQLIDFKVNGETVIDNFNVEYVSCGTRHTIIKTESKQFFVTGWNRHGQLGLPLREDEHKITDFLSEIEVWDEFSELKIDGGNFFPICGNWSTVFIMNK